MARFRNTATGREIMLPDVPATKDRVRQSQHAHMLTLMQRSKRWQRIDTEPAAPAGESESPQPPAGGAQMRSAGGGWYEIVVAGEVVDKVRGAEAAQAALAKASDQAPQGDDW